MNQKNQMNSLDGVKMAAMADELAAIHREKVAIGVGQVGTFLGNMATRAATAAPKVMGALEGVGSRVMGGAVNAIGNHGGAVGQRVAGGLMGGMARAGNAVGGAQNLNRLVGGGLAAGAGTVALGGAGLAANRMMRGPQTTVNVQR